MCRPVPHLKSKLVLPLPPGGDTQLFSVIWTSVRMKGQGLLWVGRGKGVQGRVGKWVREGDPENEMCPEQGEYEAREDRLHKAHICLPRLHGLWESSLKPWRVSAIVSW